MFDLPDDFPLDLGLLILSFLSCRDIFRLRSVSAQLPPNLRSFLESELVQEATLLRWNGKASKDVSVNDKAERFARQHALGRPATCRSRSYHEPMFVEHPSACHLVLDPVVRGRYMLRAVNYGSRDGNFTTAFLYDMVADAWLHVAPRIATADDDDVRSLILTDTMAVVVLRDCMLITSLTDWRLMSGQDIARIKYDPELRDRLFTGISKTKALRQFTLAFAGDRSIIAMLCSDQGTDLILYDYEKDSEVSLAIKLSSPTGGRLRFKATALVVDASEKLVTVLRHDQDRNDKSYHCIIIDRFGFDGSSYSNACVGYETIDFVRLALASSRTSAIRVTPAGGDMLLLTFTLGGWRREHRLLMRVDGVIEGVACRDHAVGHWKGGSYVMANILGVESEDLEGDWYQYVGKDSFNFVVGEEFAVSWDWNNREMTMWSFGGSNEDGRPCYEDEETHRRVSLWLAKRGEYDEEKVFKPVTIRESE